MSDGDNRGTAAARLSEHVGSLEGLLERRDEINDLIKSKKQEVKGEGFVVKAVMQIIKEREAGPVVVREWNSIMSTYRGAMNMLHGDSLPDSARRRLDEPPADHDSEGQEIPREEDVDQDISEFDIQDARQEGADAAVQGKKIAENPYPAGDARRAAWDEGWCSSTGGTGMEIPMAFQRKTKKAPKKKGEPDGDGGEQK